MKNPVHIMTALIRKLRKRKLSSELHSRWGDVSITYPNAGSWSQYDQIAMGTPNSFPSNPPEQTRRHGSLDSLDRRGCSSQNLTRSFSGDTEERTPSTDSAMTIPTGHYDAKLRGRSKKKPATSSGSKLNFRSDLKLRKSPVDSSCDETDDSISSLSSLKRRYHKESSRAMGQENDVYARASKSPPLSVTSRMRRCSLQSTTTEPTPSMPTSSSKHTSYTSSVPSVPSEDPRVGYQPTAHDKRYSRRSKPRDPAPSTAQELVPSYDELYG
ncbi:hypothetical protein BDV25DRAFT_150752 [Aspergillus avenaceus]|uniref:Uncharacterized protein n=1 Tax=Aspergillus avenaceus TaxID=36643 RepID=A0A5N6U2H9_ASPAV|nr:hypothetical protein BDV25DRAFT_150752 [Aspergillus avenaceus]